MKYDTTYIFNKSFDKISIDTLQVLVVIKIIPDLCLQQIDFNSVTLLIHSVITLDLWSNANNSWLDF